MATGKTVAVLAVAAAVCVVFFAQEAASQGPSGTVKDECQYRPNCTAILKDCPNPCCHGTGTATAGYPDGPEIQEERYVNALAVKEGKCVCCKSPESCILMRAAAQNPETQATAYDEVCKVYSGGSAKP